MVLYNAFTRWVCLKLREKYRHKLYNRPDATITGNSPLSVYLYRWFVIPRNRWANVYLHVFMRSDDDRALHCHPWCSVSFIIGATGYEEIYARRKWYLFGPVVNYVRTIPSGSIVFRRARFRHRIVLNGDGMPVTLFLTGPRVREWGFWCPKGFVHWKKFTAHDDPGRIGRGCE